MSTYITAEGSLKFDSKERLLEAVKPLVTGGWLAHEDGKYIWQNEGGEPIMFVSAVCEDTCTLTIPNWSYRDLGRVTDNLLSLASSGSFRWYSTDGLYSLGAWRDGVSTCVEDCNQIVSLSGADDQQSIDVLTMGSDKWESIYDEGDYYEYLTDVMEAAFDRI